MTDEIRAKLDMLADEKARFYVLRTTPTLQSEQVIGVKVPDLRKIAKDIVKSDWQCFLQQAKDDTLEERMLCGFVTATAKMPDAKRFEHIRNFLPMIDNWMVCDTFCNTLKPTKQNERDYWDFILPYFHDSREYYVRFAVVMLLSHFARDEYADRAFEILDSLDNDSYYVKMASAWAISVYFVHCPEKTMHFLNDNRLDDFTFNKALQKITESYRVNDETKSIIRKMKRKCNIEKNINDD